MNTLIFRTFAPLITAVMLVFSVFILLRGHNEPGGGFIGGLIAASAIAIYGMANGVGRVRRALRVHPMSIAGFGVLIAGLSGFLSLSIAAPFLTGIWSEFEFLGAQVAVSTVMVFDIGVYFVVLGVIGALALALEDEEEEV